MNSLLRALIFGFSVTASVVMLVGGAALVVVPVLDELHPRALYMSTGFIIISLWAALSYYFLVGRNL